MQLVCRYDVPSPLVMAFHLDGESVDMAAHPGCLLIPFAGTEKDLGRIGPEPELFGEPPTERYPSKEELDAEDVAGDHWLRVVAGQVYKDNRLPVPDTRPFAAPPESDPATLTAYLGHVRWTKETGGVTVDGVTVATDRASQAAVEKLASRAARDPKFAPQFKGSDGAFHDVGNAGLLAIGDVVSDHVQACFDTERDCLADITAGKITAFRGIDNAFAKIGTAPK